MMNSKSLGELSEELQFRIGDVMNCRGEWYPNWKEVMGKCIDRANSLVDESLDKNLIDVEQAQKLRHLIDTVDGYSRESFRTDICGILGVEYKEPTPQIVIICR